MSCLSRRASGVPFWSLAVFAHNEAGRIRAALERVVAAAGGFDVDVWVLANGCTDATADEVRSCADRVPNLWLAEISLADKANAWNVYVHQLITPDRAAQIDVHFFTDGDVTLEPEAIFLLAAALVREPGADAVGGMPANGRDKAGWRTRMVRYGRLPGNLYALRSPFVDEIRRRQIRIPVGLIGEDMFVSWMVTAGIARRRAAGGGPACIFCPTAEFSFRSLSPWRFADYRLYLRRLRRYALRALQLEMLTSIVDRDGFEAVPAHVLDLYRTAPLPSRSRWVGIDTPLRLLALFDIRRRRAEALRAAREE